MATLCYERVDDYLGPGATRFFGAGYRRADYQVVDLTVTAATSEEPGVRAAVTVRYPRDWSKKTVDVDLRPHLSSIDTLVLGAQLSEVYLAHANGLDAGARRKMWLRRVNLKAGTVPQEELEELPAVVTPRSTTAAGGEDGNFVSVLDFTVGAMRAQFEIEHGIARPNSGAVIYQSIVDALGDAESRYYGDGFKYRRQIVEDVEVDTDALSAEAMVRLESLGHGHFAAEGVNGENQPSVSMVDCFVTNLQLAQVLMYELDSVRRSESNTLWMLQTVLTADRPAQPYSAPLPVRTTVTGKHLLQLRGGSWRNVDIAGDLGGVRMRSSLAHELPATSVLHSA